MADEKEKKRAEATYRALCAMLDENDWHYEKNEEKLSILCSAKGDDLSIPIRMAVDVERQFVMLTSPMPFEIPEDRRASVAVAVALANHGLIDGSFDYDFLTGNLLFRLTSSFVESIVDRELLEYMLYVSCNTIDEYNDKFLAVSETDMSFDEIVKFIE